MMQARSQEITLDNEGLVLLDEALRISFTRLYDTDVLDLDRLHEMRDVLIAAMAPWIARGETDVWRIARRGIFAGCAVDVDARTV
jgi:hypothetical protein